MKSEPAVRFTVVAVHEDKCWIQDAASGRDEIVPLAICSRVPTLH